MPVAKPLSAILRSSSPPPGHSAFTVPTSTASHPMEAEDTANKPLTCVLRRCCFLRFILSLAA
ncbi:uncharacterized protein N7473_009758 [Penicillium subrubescens]|uniref:uncharacterized protein n=1 Tax=Penicillium subrubescens TaxID=1316194 RepID=UPI002545395D|nr:uncharacterized protein N7473_009758 [Penicillium subrubescens]KAJ5882872.1 hypothetical protein N7473_009758 [Penicillium subrubescens]